MQIYKILFILLLFCSCVEHEFFFQVSPDGSFQVYYSAHGDKIDLQDHDFPLPSGVEWTIHSTMEEIEAESYDYTAHRFFNRNEKFPETFFMGDSIYSESLLKHPTEIRHSNWFFWETFIFKGEIKGRFMESKYPLIAQLKASPDNPPEHWLQEGLSYLLSETLNQTSLEWNIRPIIEMELNNWIQNYLQTVNDSILFEELDYYKNLGLDVIMQPAPPDLYSEMDSIFKSLEDELKITMDLDGDNFIYKLVLPGVLQSNNADSLARDTLLWIFELKDFMNGDYVMTAQSTVDYPERKKAGIALLSILGCLFIGLKIRKKVLNNCFP